MACMRCGRETQEGQAFCLKCSHSMAAYPVEPDTPVQLPRRSNAAPPKKAPRRRVPTPEERVITLTHRVRHLTVAVLILLLLVIALAIPVVQNLTANHIRTGQNYTFLPASEPTVPVTEAAGQ